MTVPIEDPYVAVDPGIYQGNWTGKYADQKTFKITVSNVTGFRAKVQYQSGGTNKYQEVLIKDNAFRIGDTKFTLTGTRNTAQIKNVVTDPASGQTCSTSLRDAFLSGGRNPRIELAPLFTVDQNTYAQAMRSVARRRVGASLVRSSVWK